MKTKVEVAFHTPKAATLSYAQMLATKGVFVSVDGANKRTHEDVYFVNQHGMGNTADPAGRPLYVNSSTGTAEFMSDCAWNSCRFLPTRDIITVTFSNED